MLISCQEKKADSAVDTASEIATACSSLSIDDCETIENCAILAGVPITANEDETCYFEGEPQAYACIDLNEPCPPTVVYAYEPTTSNLVMFTYGCQPNGWESTDLNSYEECES